MVHLVVVVRQLNQHVLPHQVVGGRRHTAVGHTLCAMGYTALMSGTLVITLQGGIVPGRRVLVAGPVGGVTVRMCYSNVTGAI